MGRTLSGPKGGVGRADGLRAALAAAAVVAFAAVTGALAQLDYRLYDTALAAGAVPPPPGITLVGIDEAGAAALGTGPEARAGYARLIDALTAAGAKTVVLLPPLDGPQSGSGLAYLQKIRSTVAASGDTSALAGELGRAAEEGARLLDGDARLAESLQRAGNVFLASQYAVAGGTPAPLPPFAQRSALADPGALAVPATAARHPADRIGTAAAGVGHWLATPDGDGTVRRIPLLLRYDNVGIPSLALLAARHSLHLGPREVQWDEARSGVQVGGLLTPTDAAARMLPRWYGTPEAGARPFPVVPLVQVLNGAVPPQRFKDQVVLVGETGGTLAPPWAVGGGGTLAPVEALAHAVSALGHGLGVRQPAWSLAAGWGAALVALLGIALGLPRLSGTAGAALGGALFVALIGAEWALLRHAGLWVTLVPGALALLAGTAMLWLLRWSPGASAGGTARDAGEAAEADRMLALALHGQGQLDKAFERLRKLPPSDALLDNLYHLGQDFERKGNLARAKSVYKHILQHNKGFRDAYVRYKRVRAQLHKDPGTPSSTPASVPPAAAPRLAGDASVGVPQLGRYQIERELGKGAMGVVYLGRDPKIGRVVAIKTLALAEEFEGHALVDARARFFREAETAGRLQHPCIVTIFDAGEEHDLAYIAMEFLKGADLAQACRSGHLLPVPTVLSIAARVADALDYAHAHQVVHRDIKPANIMFDPATDAVKVTDFGIARITDASKTRTGLVLGTPSFMSPEQLAGKKVDGRSDLYSLGVTLFQLLTGSLPLRGESMPELMHKIANVEAPDVRQLRPDLPAEVARAVALALQKRPESRYQTGRQFAADLRQAAALAGLEAPLRAEAVDYDARRDATGHEMADSTPTVMAATPAGRDAPLPSPPAAGAR